MFRLITTGLFSDLHLAEKDFKLKYLELRRIPLKMLRSFSSSIMN